MRTLGDKFLVFVYRFALPLNILITGGFGVCAAIVGEYGLSAMSFVVTICTVLVVKKNWNVGSEKYNELLKIPPKAKVVK